MKLMQRLERLEGRTGAEVPRTDVLLICSVEPSPDGPVNKGPILARILTGPNRGQELWRNEGETEVAFVDRVEIARDSG